MEYSLAIARHRFSMWAACRAAQAGSAKAKRSELIAALSGSGVVEFISEPKNHAISLEQYDSEFEKWVLKTQRHLEDVAKKPVMFGVAAKLVSTYLKSMVLLGGLDGVLLSWHLTPPIDSILLKGLDKAYGTKLTSEYKWQKLSRQDYVALVSELRRLGANSPAWHLEQHWEP